MDDDPAPAAPSDPERFIHAFEFQKALIAAGVIGLDTRRVVIDAEAGEVVKVYVEKYATARLLEVVPHVAKGAEIRVLTEEA